jgi:hypothetical protein
MDMGRACGMHMTEIHKKVLAESAKEIRPPRRPKCMWGIILNWRLKIHDKRVCSAFVL